VGIGLISPLQQWNKRDIFVHPKSIYEKGRIYQICYGSSQDELPLS